MMIIRSISDGRLDIGVAEFFSVDSQSIPKSQSIQLVKASSESKHPKERRKFRHPQPLPKSYL